MDVVFGLIVALGSAIIGGAVTLILAIRQWKKDAQSAKAAARTQGDQAEVDKVAVILESWDDFTEKITQDRDRLEHRVQLAEEDARNARIENLALREDNSKLRADVAKLTAEVEGLRAAIIRTAPPVAADPVDDPEIHEPPKD